MGNMITVEQIQKAAEFLKGKVIRTPLVFSPNLSKMTGMKVYLKLENLQETGSFKLRGATLKIGIDRSRIGSKGVVAASAGNHAQGVALAASRLGMPATIVMPEWASISKQEATRGYGGEVVLCGKSVGDALDKAREIAGSGKTFIHPYDDLDIIRGQGTIGLEILEELPDADLVLVPVGGGGLIGGIATAVKGLRPQAGIIGVQAAACPSAYMAKKNGEVLHVDARKSLADGISVKQIGEVNFGILREYVDEVVLVEEDRIAEAMLMLLERKKILTEGAGAVPLAALLNGSVSRPGAKVVLVVSGGNVDSPLLDRVIRMGLSRNGRVMRFSVYLEDIPGSLASLLTLVARLQANVLSIRHVRTGKDLPIYLTKVELELETRGWTHIEELVGELRAAGYRVRTELEE